MNNPTVRSAIKDIVRSVVAAVAPRHYSEIFRGQIDPIAESLISRYGCKTICGPFAGMHYVRKALCSPLPPKLIGSYECELHGALAQILKEQYDTVVDIGCAEGYYAVGLARNLPSVPTVYAFDGDPGARRICREMALKNDVEGQLKIGGFCGINELKAVLKGKSLVVCDCEGYEIFLMQPKFVPALREAEILLELHDCIIPELTEVITKRFESTHTMTIIDSTERDASHYPEVSFLTAEEQKRALAERNIFMQWAHLKPHLEH